METVFNVALKKKIDTKKRYTQMEENMLTKDTQSFSVAFQCSFTLVHVFESAGRV